MARKGYNLMVLWVMLWLVVEIIVNYWIGPSFVFWRDSQMLLVQHYRIYAIILSLLSVTLFFTIYSMPIYGYVTGKAITDRRMVVKRTFDISIYTALFAFVFTGIIPMGFMYLKLDPGVMKEGLYAFVLWIFATAIAYGMILIAGLDFFSTYIAESLRISRRERFGFFKRSLKFELPLGVITTVLFSVMYSTLIQFGAFNKYSAQVASLLGESYISLHKQLFQERLHYLGWMLIFFVILFGIVVFSVTLEGLKRSKALSILRDIFPKVKEGYLDIRAYSITPDEIGSVVLYLNEMVEKNAKIVKHIKETVEVLNRLSEQVKTSIDSSFAAIMEQTGAVGELSAAAQELEKTSEEIHSFITRVAKFADETSKKVLNANSVMQETLDSYSNLINWIQTISEEVIKLEQRSAGIVEIVRTIQNIARETRILSVNAAIEAEAAGESGKRFTIVAEEIRKLAGDSDGAARNIEKLAKEINEIIDRAVVSFENSLAEASSGEENIRVTREYLREIIESSKLIRDWTNEATQYTNEEQKSSQNVALAAANLNSAIKNLSASAKQIASAYEELVKSVKLLVEDISEFKV